VLDENPRNREAGQAVIIIMAVCLTVFLGFAALATDVGMLFHDKRLIQTAADSAAIAGASELNNGDVTASAQGDAAKNGVTDGVNGATVVVNNPPLSGPHTCANDATYCNNYVEVIATQSKPTFFLNVFGRSAVSVSARAVAYPGNGADAGCVYALATSGDGISMSGNGTLSVPNCSVYVDSNISMKGATSITAGAVGVVGTASGSITPSPVTLAATVADPLAYLPAPTVPPVNQCITPPKSPATLTPGYYCGINGAYTLQSGGLYIVGSLNLSGNVSGTNVTVYLTNGGGVSLSGTNSLTLTAESCATTTGVCADGTYNGVAYFQDRTDSTKFSYGDTAATLSITGIMYMPDAELEFKGSPSSTLDASIVCSTLVMKGGPTLAGPPISGGIFPIKVATLAE
jgi:hypothetical protein